jgi:hypothetical protein
MFSRSRAIGKGEEVAGEKEASERLAEVESW